MRTRRIALFVALPHACYGSERIERRFVGPLPALTKATHDGGVPRTWAASGGQLVKSSGIGLESSRGDEASVKTIKKLDVRTGAFAQAVRAAARTDARGPSDNVAVGERQLRYEPSAPCERCLTEDNESATKGGESDGLDRAKDEDGSADVNGDDATDDGKDGTDDGEGGEEEVECAHASTCDACAAVPLQDDGSMCWWNGTHCQEEEPSDSEHDVDTMCGDGNTQTEAPTPAKDAGKIADEPRAGENTTPSMAPTVVKADGSSATSSPTSKPVERATPAPTVKATPAPTPKTATPAPVAAKTETKAPTSAPVRPTSETEGVDDESSFGGTPAMLIGVILLVGVVACLRRRAAPVGATRGAGGGGFGSVPSQPSYQGVATNDDDEEWGWGDEEAHADVELASKKVDMDPSQPVRKGMSLKGGGIGGLPKKSPPPVQKSRMSSATIRQGRSRERDSISSPDKNFHAAEPASPPPPASPPSRGANSTTYRPALSPPPLASAPAQKPGPPPPAPSSTKRSDDIFAELGLSANPTFSKPVVAAAPAPYSSSARPPPAPSSGGSSPWQQKVAKTSTAASASLSAGGGFASSTASRTADVAAATSSTASSALYRQPVSMDDIASSASDPNPPQWDDDADLDDLLDD